MSAFRISKHKVRGQFATAACFEAWLVQQKDAGNAELITLREELGIPPGGDNDWRYYIWRQDAAQVNPPVGCAYDLVKVGTQIDWPTAAAALAVVDGKVKEAAKVDAQVKAANEKATSASNIAAGLANDAADAVGDAANALSPSVKIGVGVGLGVFALWVISKLVGK